MVLGLLILVLFTRTDGEVEEPVASAGGQSTTVAEPVTTTDPSAENRPSEAPGIASADVVAPVQGVQPAPSDLGGAEAFAMQFAQGYLNYDDAMPEVRARELSRFLAPGLDPQLGWSGVGRQLAVLTIATDSRRGEDGLVTVTVAAQVTGSSAPRWVYLDVRMDQDTNGIWAVVAAPAFVPRPSPGVPDLPVEPVDDPDLSDTLAQPLGQFFAAYGSEATVQIDGVTISDRPVDGLDGQFVFVGLTDVRVHASGTDRRSAVAVVVWDNLVSGGTVEQSYDVDLVLRDGNWLVESVNAG